jgi:hypothetical protein
MVFGGTMCTENDIKYRAGANVNSTATAEAYLTAFALSAESYVNSRSNYNWTDSYSTLNADVKYILTDAVASIAAIYAINYDMSGFTSRQEALVMINILWARVEECLKLLEKEANRDFVGSA